MGCGVEGHAEHRVPDAPRRYAPAEQFALHRGDNAIVFNAYALQEDSRFGKSRDGFSDAHDLVLVPLRLPRQSRAARSSGRAEQPTRRDPEAPQLIASGSSGSPNHDPTRPGQILSEFLVNIGNSGGWERGNK